MSAGNIATSNAPGSVTSWLDQLRGTGQNHHLQQEIWNRYFPKLAVVARRHLAPATRRTVDEEDVALSALNAFFFKVSSGQLSRLSDRAQLWALLTTIATHKAINVRRKHVAKKRGGGMVHGDSWFSTDELRNLATADPGPQELAEFRELVTNMLEQLDPTLKKIAHNKLIGKPDWEIAEELGVSPRTVARKLMRIRSLWCAEFGLVWRTQQ